MCVNKNDGSKIVYSSKVAKELIARGFKLKKVMPNKKYDNFSVYVFFDDDNTLMNVVAEITRK